jgi:hypothetical protein
MNVSMDCILGYECSKVGIVYVSKSGFDTLLCADKTRMCESVDYVFSHRVIMFGTIYISSPGEYGISCRSGQDSSMALEGIDIPLNANESDYPGIYPANASEYWFDVSISEQELSVTNFRIYYPTTTFTRYLFLIRHGNIVLITNCFIYHNSTATDYYINGVIYGGGGALTMMNVVAHDLVFIVKGFYNNEYLPVWLYSFYNCSYYSILQKSNVPAIYYSPYVSNCVIVNNSFVNITHLTAGSMGCVFDLGFTISVRVSDLYFENISGKCSAARFTDIGSHVGDSALCNLVFRNVFITDYDGAAIYMDPSSDVTNAIVDSMFINCSTTSAFGGLFVNVFEVMVFFFFFFFFVQVLFILLARGFS